MFIRKMWINKQPFTSLFFSALERILACVVVQIAAVDIKMFILLYYIIIYRSVRYDNIIIHCHHIL